MTTDRWQQAQHYEHQWWKDRESSINLTFYKAFAEEMMEQLNGCIDVSPSLKVLEIGSGAAGIITHVPSDLRFAIDPLEDFYATVPAFTSYRDPAVQYLKASGEKLPYQDSYFDLIIVDNVLDHCDDMEQVMKEMHRALRPGGIVYFRQNVYHPWGYFIRTLMEIFVIDRGHPHTFTYASLVRLVRNTGWTVLKHQRSGYFKRWKYELSRKTKNDLLKAVLFVTRDKTMMILRKEG